MMLYSANYSKKAPKFENFYLFDWQFMIISCADSRVDPCKIMGLDIGDAFVLRNIANLVPPYSSVRDIIKH